MLIAHIYIYFHLVYSSDSESECPSECPSDNESERYEILSRYVESERYEILSRYVSFKLLEVTMFLLTIHNSGTEDNGGTGDSRTSDAQELERYI